MKTPAYHCTICSKSIGHDSNSIRKHLLNHQEGLKVKPNVINSFKFIGKTRNKKKYRLIGAGTVTNTENATVRKEAFLFIPEELRYRSTLRKT